MSDDLAELADDLHRAATRASEEARAVVTKGAVNIKKEWRDNWKRRLAGGHAKRLHYSVGYDISSGGGDEIVAVIGPDANNDRMQGPLGGIIEHGSVNNAPIPAGGPALLRESPRFEDALGDMGERLLDGA